MGSYVFMFVCVCVCVCVCVACAWLCVGFYYFQFSACSTLLYVTMC